MIGTILQTTTLYEVNIKHNLSSLVVTMTYYDLHISCGTFSVIQKLNIVQEKKQFLSLCKVDIYIVIATGTYVHWLCHLISVD